MTVDLRQCKPGDRLLTKHGTILEYVGQMFVHICLTEDEDIVEILK